MSFDPTKPYNELPRRYPFPSNVRCGNNIMSKYFNFFDTFPGHVDNIDTISEDKFGAY